MGFVNQAPLLRPIDHMKNHFLFSGSALFAVCVLGLAVHAQGTLPPCPTNAGYRHNCSDTVEEPNGDRYEGEFLYGRRHGKGTYTFKKGDRYTGQFKDDGIEGSGVYVWTNGDEYTGEFTAGRADGYGRYRYRNGDVYTGEFRKGRRDGKGRLEKPSMETFEGSFKADRLVKGTYRYQDGTTYVGEFLQDKRDGKGTRFDKDGKAVQAGYWRQDEFVGEKRP